MRLQWEAIVFLVIFFSKFFDFIRKKEFQSIDMFTCCQNLNYQWSVILYCLCVWEIIVCRNFCEFFVGWIARRKVCANFIEKAKRNKSIPNDNPYRLILEIQRRLCTDKVKFYPNLQQTFIEYHSDFLNHAIFNFEVSFHHMI